jgi:hypothetical protein
MVSKGMALECSLIYFIPIRLPADILLAKDKIPVKPLSGNNTHSNRDAGLHGAGRIMVGYLKQILAILSRSSSMRAPMRCKQSRKLKLRLVLLYFEFGHLSGKLFHVSDSLRRIWRMMAWVQPGDPE